MFDFITSNEQFASTTTSSTARNLAHAFIERLARDDEFRALIVADPVAATAQYGFSIDPGKLPENGITLPSKALMIEHLDRIAEEFSVAAEVIVMFRL